MIAANTDARPPSRRSPGTDPFEALLTTWLASLPAAGWRGLVAELERALDAADVRTAVFIPMGDGLSRALIRHHAAIRAAGWRCEVRRVSRATVVVFTRRGGE